MAADVALLGDTPFLILQLLLDELMIGAIFAVATYGMALIWGVMNVINVVQGEFVMLGGFITYQLTLWGLSPHASERRRWDGFPCCRHRPAAQHGRNSLKLKSPPDAAAPAFWC